MTRLALQSAEIRQKSNLNGLPPVPMLESMDYGASSRC
jgi:hypothetical protein